MKIADITKTSELGDILYEHSENLRTRGYKAAEDSDIEFIERNYIILKNLDDDVFIQDIFGTNYIGKNYSFLKYLMEKQAKKNGTISEYDKEYDDLKFDAKDNKLSWYGEI